MPTDHLDLLFDFLRFPTISTQSAHDGDLRACADWLSSLLSGSGLESAVHETPGHPVVLARTAPHDPAKRTVLVYGHYDVQPPEPLDLWRTPPFEPTVVDGRIFARGSTDNKGQILAHVLGVRDLLAAEGSLPVNVIFLIEGEEEIGSPNLEKFLAEHRDELRCDLVCISDNGMVSDFYPTLAYALRGITALEATVRGPSVDLHSGVYGGAVMNPATAAARLVASLHDDFGRVLIDGFYDDVQPMADWEREAAAALPTSDADFLEQTGSPALFGEKGFTAIEQIGARPTAEVNGIGGGYQGEGSKTVLPAEAFFKLTFRLVANQDPAKISKLAEAHLRAHCPPGVTLEIDRGHHGEPYFTDPTTPDGQATLRALESIFGQQPALLREGGSIPILTTFKKILGVESYLPALASPDCAAHSPNENFPVRNFETGIQLSQTLLREYARVQIKGDVTVTDRTRRTA